MKKMFGKKMGILLAGLVLMAGMMVGCNSKKNSTKSGESEIKQTLSPKKVPAYLKVKNQKDGTWVIDYNASIIPEKLTIPNGIVRIGVDAFKNCELLESVKIPGSVKRIADDSFRGCKSLASVTLTKGLEEIGEAFYECTALKSITIPEGGVKIENHSFGKCSALETVTIAKDVSGIGYGAFKGCTALKEVRYYNTLKRFKLIAHENAFEKDVVIHCTDGDYVIGSDAE